MVPRAADHGVQAELESISDRAMHRVFGSEQPNWVAIAYLAIMHALSLLALPYIFSAHRKTLLFGVVLYFFSALGITAGAHRLYSHKSWRASWPVRLFLVAWCSCANQGSVYHWARDHRVHHKFSETTKDPHNAIRGFFFAHIGWLLVRKHPDVIEAGKQLQLKDLQADRIVMFQDAWNTPLALLCCFAAPAWIPHHFWGEDLWTAFLIGSILRYTLVLHATWLVNSWAHLEGSRPYDPAINPAENRFVALVSGGEGWHNWHHAFPWDYAASEFGIHAQWNPTKLFIDGCCMLGLATGRRRADKVWDRRQKDGSATLSAAGARETVEHPPSEIGGVAPFRRRNPVPVSRVPSID